MKRIYGLFAIVAMLFMFSCGNVSNNNSTSNVELTDSTESMLTVDSTTIDSINIAE